MQWLQGTEYFDSSKVSSTGRYSVGVRGMQMPVGVHELFDESGRLLAQSTYDERGRISCEIVWDAQGQLLRDDAVFKEGSRKAFAK